MLFCLILVVLINPVFSQIFYINGGALKFVIGLSIPIDIEFSGASLSWFTNVQAFYDLPDNVTYFEPYNVVQKRSAKNTFNRFTIYKALNEYFKSQGILGNDCIHKLICQVARKKLIDGLFGDFIHTLFSPNKDFHSGLKEHKKAFWQGQNNASTCDNIYPDCSISKDSIFF